MKKDQQEKEKSSGFSNAETTNDQETAGDNKDEWNDGIIQEKENTIGKREEDTLGNP
jgi:hypothetical protein